MLYITTLALQQTSLTGIGKNHTNSRTKTEPLNSNKNPSTSSFY